MVYVLHVPSAVQLEVGYADKTENDQRDVHLAVFRAA